MSEDLTAKYRPQKLSDIIGQDPVIESLKSILATDGKLPPAILLHGPSGVGKTSIGRVLAREIKCSPSNLIEIDGASNTGVEDARKITELMSFLPIGGGSRVVIVDECQRLSKQAFDSLLKSMEEPPELSSWVLCSTEPSKIPVTVKTRCHTYELKKISVSKIVELLKHICKEEKIELASSILNYLAIKAQGSARQAVVYLSMSRNAESLEKVQQLIKSADVSEIPAVIEFCRVLLSSTNWADTVSAIKSLEGEDNEGVRITTRNYFSKVVLNSAGDLSKTQKCLTILDAFAIPFNQSDKLAPIIVAAAKCQS